MACLFSHTVDEIHALVQKLIHEDSVRQKAMMDLAVQFDNANAAKQDLRQAYEKCNDISQETHNLIDAFLKRESDKDYEMNLAMYRKAGKIEKQIEAKYDEEVLRETLEEQARSEKEWEDRIKKEEAEGGGDRLYGGDIGSMDWARESEGDGNLLGQAGYLGRELFVDLACVLLGCWCANNDINVLDNSPLFDDLLDDLAPVVSYVVNGVEYRNGYYLADGIYPEWASFVKSFTVATDLKHS
ncbi:zinc finger, CCHC-type containing protein [Tanacetum coccineum]